ncbi:acetamidase/formamidase family protein [Synechococcus sp. UW140]|uniref:acetamidase/formamidase family protein n=1 Tax=Synechococcus sp. UW140 TaxID=368503 RepID=UPI0031378D52
MAHHLLESNPNTIHWGHLDAAISPKLTVNSGDLVVIDTLSGGRGDLGGDLSFVRANHRQIIENVMPIDGPHILTGPIAIRGAEPGDTLEVKIVEIELTENWGYNLIRPGAGVLPEEFPHASHRILPIDRQSKTTKLPWGVELPLDPFFGVLAVAPAPDKGRVSSVPPGEFGGNIDNKELRVGSSLFLPIFVAGANFSAGDGHAVQGDGEIDVTALETCLKGSFQLILHKRPINDPPLDFPRAITNSHYISMGFDANLNVAAQQASRRMLDWLVSITGWNREEAYVFCSLACDLHITQMVNRNRGVHAMVRRELIP